MKQKSIILILLILVSLAVYGQQYKDYYSSWDDKRPARSHTLCVVLHTTEGNDKSSLESVHALGTCNFLVATDGTIYRIISRNKIAKHAGRSMWNNHSNLSEISIGIEVVGYHDKKPTDKQLAALKKLIATLKAIYGLRDDQILCHSMVAYGSPNKWFPFNHRGRKRCGMLFATKEIREKMGLKNTFTTDPDVKAGRLQVADPYLESVLYGLPQGNESAVKGAAEPQQDDEESFEGFKVIGREGVKKIAGNEYKSSTTIYFFSDGKIRTGKELTKTELDNIPKDTKVLVGYVYGGKISSSRTAYSVVGKKWNFPSTYYRLPDGTVKTGDEVDGSLLKEGTIILFRK